MPLATMDSWGSESLAEQAYRILERSIVTLELEPGTVVNERTLIELTGMGRTPMREAIQRLAREGLVEVRPRSGIAIAAIDPTDFIKVLDAREGVERVLARDAARFGSPRDYERLEAAAAAMRQAIPTRMWPCFSMPTRHSILFWARRRAIPMPRVLQPPANPQPPLLVPPSPIDRHSRFCQCPCDTDRGDRLPSAGTGQRHGQ